MAQPYISANGLDNIRIWMSGFVDDKVYRISKNLVDTKVDKLTSTFPT
jgi:hypothetical protein